MGKRNEHYIGLSGILNLLGRSKGPNGSGEYMCKCPAHDDKQASLCVREGDSGIVMKCQAGCGFTDICARLGIQQSELFKELPERGQGRCQTAAAKPKPLPKEPDPMRFHDVKTYSSYAEAYRRIGEVVKVYPYTSANGRLLFEVARINAADGSGKTFRQHRPVDGAKGAFPFVTGVPEEIRRGILYRLPNVSDAVRNGATVYVVEGEKDADTIAAMGYCGTTSPMGAGKWTKEHSEHLRGAHVVILPDNDKPGEEHAQLISRSLAQIAADCYVVRIRDGYEALPEKGDVTDMVSAIGIDKAREILDALVEKTRNSLYEKAIFQFNNLPGYCVADGCICQRNEDSKRVLGTFVAAPVCELTTDDGATVEKNLLIDGWNIHGKPMRQLRVPLAKFKNMDWAMEGWGLTANISAGQNIRDKLRFAIAEIGARIMDSMTIYKHTGWRRINGKWNYLYDGGCVGSDDVTVEMGKGVDMYTLTETPEGISREEAALSSFSTLDVFPPHISVPMLGITYLAPLREFLYEAGYPPCFITMLKGKSQTHKTTCASVYMMHFGTFSERRRPCNFADTANYVRKVAFLAKDMITWVDDYHPVTSLQEKRRMDAIAQSLSRAFGDLSDRGRLNAESGMQTSEPPRSICLMTGEDTPDIGTSGHERFYTINVNPNDIPASDALTALQEKAFSGELRAAMRYYVEWLQPKADTLPERFKRMFVEYRSRAKGMVKNSAEHGRTVENVAQIMIGLTMMLNYFEEIGLIDYDSAAALIEDYWNIVSGNSKEQFEEREEETPVSMYLRAIQEMLMSHQVAVQDITPGAEHTFPQKGMIGYADQNYYYLLSELTMTAITKFYHDQDRVFPLRKQELHRQLRDSGIVDTDGEGKATRLKRTPDGKTHRYLWIPRYKIEGRDAPTKQESMEFKDVPDEDIPKEWRK